MSVEKYRFPAYADPEILSDGWSGDLCPLCGYPMERTETVRTPLGERGPPSALAPEDGMKPLLHDECWRHARAEELPNTIGTTDSMGRLETFISGYNDEEYLLESSMGSSRLMLLRGTCSGTVADDHGDTYPCGYEARCRRVTEEGFIDRCGMHVPDEWDAAEPPERDIYGCADLELVTGCEKYVSRDSGGGEAFAGHDDFDARAAWGGAESGPCSDRAFLAIQPADGDPLVFCRRHARQSWVDTLRVVPNDPTLRER
jgi:hypothetical protein